MRISASEVSITFPPGHWAMQCHLDVTQPLAVGTRVEAEIDYIAETVRAALLRNVRDLLKASI